VRRHPDLPLSAKCWTLNIQRWTFNLGTVTPGAFLPRCRVLSDYVFVMRPRSATPLLLLAAATGGVLTAAQPSDAQLDFFEKRIRPISAECCYECHSAEKKQKGGLSLDTRAARTRRGAGGEVLSPQCSVLSQQERFRRQESEH